MYIAGASMARFSSRLASAASLMKGRICRASNHNMAAPRYVPTNEWRRQATRFRTRRVRSGEFFRRGAEPLQVQAPQRKTPSMRRRPWIQITSIVRSFFRWIAARRRIQAHRELRDVAAFECADLADALFLHFVDSQDGMHGQHGALDVRELGLDALLARIHDHGGALAEYQFLDFNEAKQATLAHFAGVDLVNLALVHEHNLENVTGCHLAD